MRPYWPLGCFVLALRSVGTHALGPNGNVLGLDSAITLAIGSGEGMRRHGLLGGGRNHGLQPVLTGP